MTSKPIIEVVVLPPTTSEQTLMNILQRLVKAASVIPALKVKGEEDIIIHFPTDPLKRRPGITVLAKVTLPDKSVSKRAVGRAIGKTLQEIYPKAFVMCTVGCADLDDVFCSSNGFE